MTSYKSQYKNYQNFSYTELCDPNHTFIQKIKAFNKIFFSNMFRSQYYRDVNLLTKDKSVSKDDRRILERNNFIIVISDIVIKGYIPYTIYWHYKKNYFSMKNRSLYFYIFGKIIFNVFFINYLSLFAHKELNKNIIFNIYSIKEAEWKQSIEEKNAEYGKSQGETSKRSFLR